MLKKLVAGCFCAVSAVALLASCGDSKAGGVGQFNTVFATATPPASALDTDVATWVDAAGAKVTACTAGINPTITATNATYTVTSTAYAVPNTGSSSTITASPLLVTDITVTLTPATLSSPSLGSFQVFHSSPGQLIAAGAAAPITVAVAPVALKVFLQNSLGANSISCSNAAHYSYWAVTTFSAQEVNTGKAVSITAPAFMVNFADFVDA